jgi:hypothetical protein
MDEEDPEQELTQEGPGPGSAQWDGYLDERDEYGDPVLASKGVYTYRVHAGDQEVEDGCDDSDKSSGYSVDVEGFHWYRTVQDAGGDWTARCLLIYTLDNYEDRTSAACKAHIYGPDGEGDDLALLKTLDSLDCTDGRHVLQGFDVPVQADEDGQPVGTYYAVVGSLEDDLTAQELNRDKQPKPALPQGATLHNLKVTSVVWVEDYPDQLDENPKEGGGKRIFPGAPAPGQPARALLHVRATLDEAIPGVEIHFASFDVDDPSADQPPIDNEGAGPDNRGTPKEGELKPDHKPTDANGAAEVDFKVTMQPGDNFRVVAEVQGDEWLSTLVPKHPDPQGRVFDGDDPVPGEKTTELLTVWRKMHCVVESMGTPPPGTEFGEDDLPPGDVPPPDTGGVAQAFRDAYIEHAFVQGNHQEEWSYNFNLNQNTMGMYGALNRADGDGEQLYENYQYWQQWIVGAYESPWPDADNDPESEAAWPAATTQGEPDGSFIFTEIFRDYGAQWMAEPDPTKKWSEEDAPLALRAIVAHELAHPFVGGTHHGDVGPDGKPYCLMWAPGVDAEEWLAKHLPLRFCNAHLHQIRNAGIP